MGTDPFQDCEAGFTSWMKVAPHGNSQAGRYLGKLRHIFLNNLVPTRDLLSGDRETTDATR